jgi:hypothetical protein
VVGIGTFHCFIFYTNNPPITAHLGETRGEPEGKIAEKNNKIIIRIYKKIWYNCLDFRGEIKKLLPIGVFLMSFRSTYHLSFCISLVALLTLTHTASAQTPFNNISVTFNEAGFPTANNTNMVLPTQSNTVNYDVLDTAGAKGQDAVNDLLTTFIASAQGPRSTGGAAATPNLQWTTANAGAFVSNRNWLTTGAGFTNNPGTRVSTTMRMLFGSHLTVTDLNAVFSSLNTAGISWEFSTIAFLDPSGAYFTPAPSLPLYNAATSFTGSPSAGWYVAADKTTVTGVGTNLTAAGATSGTSDNFTATYANMGLAPGTQIGGFEWTTFLEDTRGTSNVATSFTTSITDFTFSGTVAAIPEPGTLALLLAPVALGFLRRRR